MWQQPSPNPPMIGPMLRYNNINIEHAVYYASILIVSPAQPAPYVSIDYGTVLEPYILDNFQGWNFYRYDLSAPIPPHDRFVSYTVQGSGTYTFTVPGHSTTVWRWAFYSCNGFSHDIPIKTQQEEHAGDTPVWNDLLQKHRTLPFHAMVGGGDQLYCDAVFHEIDEVKIWSKESKRDVKARFKVSQRLLAQIEQWYFDNYRKVFGSGPFAEAMKIIPFCFVSDDHDIFDGWGSYPDWVMNMEMIQVLGRVGFRFYLLFQQHTTADYASQHGFFGGVPRSYLTYLGPQQAVLFPDARTERTIKNIMSPSTYSAIYERLRNMPPIVKHLIVVLGVPIVYPRLSLAEKTLNSDSVKAVMGALSAGNSVNQFGLPELADDLNDHWTAECHEEERRKFIENLQEISRQKKVRVTFIAGDVHCCAAGYLSIKNGALDPRRDHKYMVQIVSSAIVNAPPPIAVIKMLQKSAKTYNLNKETDENMFDLFKNKVDGQPKDNHKLYNRRNFCAVNPSATNPGGLEFHICVEKKDHSGTVPYTVSVPPLVI